MDYLFMPIKTWKKIVSYYSLISLFGLAAGLIFSMTLCNCDSDKKCGDDYDRCCDACYEYYKQTGLSTECYSKCYDQYIDCEERKESGCFILAINQLMPFYNNLNSK